VRISRAGRHHGEKSSSREENAPTIVQFVAASSNKYCYLRMSVLQPSIRWTPRSCRNRAASVLGAANAKKTDLATLQVTQANIDELAAALQAFNAAKASPRTHAAERMAQTQSLASLIREMSGTLWNEIDPLVNLFRRTNPDLVAGYRAARVIVDRPATHATAPPSTPTPPTP
jgi:hypothetical protein